MKICIVSSSGGHLTEIKQLASVYEAYSYFYVINYLVPLDPEMRAKTMFITHSERDFRFFINLYEAYKILKKERPNAILSCGAGPAVPFALVGRALFGTRVIFIETITRVKRPSLTGRIMYRLAHVFYYQWAPLKQYYPKGIYAGPLV